MGNVTILDGTTKYPLQKIGYNAGVCWGSPVDDMEKNINRAMDCINSGHGRVMEYVDVELLIEGYSARVIREWYTHIGGSPTRLQESTRYVDESNFNFVTPISLNQKQKEKYEEIMGNIAHGYKRLRGLGVKKEDSAMVLPLGMTTKIVDKRNLRNLVDMSHQRLCTRAYWEFRILMQEICKSLSSVSQEWEWIVDNLMKPKCEVIGHCTERKSCGRKHEYR